MKLKYDFPQKVRNLYLYQYSCFLCSRSDQGLELHHILGRVSDSAFNSSCICSKCHSYMGHTREEHQNIFFYTLKFLHDVKFKPEDKDLDFLEEHAEELINGDTMLFVAQLST